jgi:hypothetical protein
MEGTQDISTLADVNGDHDRVMRTAVRILEKQAVLRGLVMYLNLTPHTLIFGSGIDEPINTAFRVPVSGYVLNAVPTMREIGKHNGIQQVRTEFVPTSSRVVDLLIRLDMAGIVIIGSQIAAQAYAGMVHSVIAATGFERVAPDQKRMNPNKFNVY